MRPRYLVVGNWKMNLGPKAGRDLVNQLQEGIGKFKQTDVWVCPPAPTIPAVAEVARSIAVGAQNIHWAKSGAFTGELSVDFLKELNCKFALIGHSERRHVFLENESLINKRLAGVSQSGLTSILCVGETLEEREAGITQKVIDRQIRTALNGVTPGQGEWLVVAYEPVWAIGTGKVAELKDIEQAHLTIGEVLEELLPGSDIPLLYGGSVTPANFGPIIQSKYVDGALVGGASLKSDQFLELVNIAEQAQE